MLGRWGTLGGLIYNFYTSGLYSSLLIWGPEMFVDDIFNAACAVILTQLLLHNGIYRDKFRLHLIVLCPNTLNLARVYRPL